MKEYQPPAVDFCLTPTAGDIHQVITLARLFDEIGTVVGGAGVGKTTALVWYAADEAGVRYCSMSPAHASVAAMLSRVSEALDAPEGISGTARLHKSVCDAIRHHAVQALLIDEAQHLDDRSLDELRSIHDDTRLPMVFAGNERLRERVVETGASAFAQFASRIGAGLVIESASEEDVRVLASHLGIADAKAVTWLAKRCVGISGLRTVVRLMKLAKNIAGEDGVRFSHLKEAADIAGMGGAGNG